MKTLLLILILITFSILSSQATDIPDLNNCLVWSVYEGSEPITLLNQPDGSGAAFNLARNGNGEIVDASLTFLAQDSFDVPIVNYPREDIWLESADGAMVSCNGGTIADQDTDENGLTYWVNPLHAGGYSQAACQAYINGEVLLGPGLPIQFNSPDITGDGEVNLIDVSYFIQDLFGDYDFRSDFHPDGVISLPDLYYLAAGVGVECP